MPRATPLPAAERRTELVHATLPLLERYGREVSTRQIAEAAGIAEGTIFRVFPTKDALLDAVIDDAFDVSHTCAELLDLPECDDLEQRLVAAVTVLQERTRRIFALFHTLRLHKAPSHDDHRARQQADALRVDAALAALLAPDAPRLRMNPTEAAHLVRAVTFALSHPMMSDGRMSSPAQIVDLVLHGITLSSSCGHKEEARC